MAHTLLERFEHFSMIMQRNRRVPVKKKTFYKLHNVKGKPGNNGNANAEKDFGD